MSDSIPVVFDLYGTLAKRTAPADVHPYEVFYSQVGAIVGKPTVEVRRVLLTRDGVDIASCCEGLIAGPMSVSQRGALKRIEKEAKLANGTYEPVEAVVRSLNDIHSSGRTVAVLSNAAQFMEAESLLRKIDVRVFTVLSYKIGSVKPSSEAFAAALSGSHSTEGIMVGDSWKSDVLGALQAGWGAVYLAEASDPAVRVVTLLQKSLDVGRYPLDDATRAVSRAFGLDHLGYKAPLGLILSRVRVCLATCELYSHIEELSQSLCKQSKGGRYEGNTRR